MATAKAAQESLTCVAAIRCLPDRQLDVRSTKVSARSPVASPKSA